MQPSLLIGKDTHRDLTHLLHDKRRLIVSGASNETAKALLIGAVFSHAPQSSLIVTDSEERVEALSHWLQFFGVTPAILNAVENAEGEIVADALQKFLLFMEEGKNHTFLCSRETWDASFPNFFDLEKRKFILILMIFL